MKFSVVVCSLAAAALAGVQELRAEPTRGAVIENVERVVPRGALALRPGDIVISWSQAAGSEARPVRSPFDLRVVVLQHLAQGDLLLGVIRDGQPVEVGVPIARWPLDIDSRPVLSGAALEAYERARTALTAKAKDVERGVPSLREAARTTAAGADDAAASCWLLARIGAAWAAADDKERSRGAYEEAHACAESLPPHARAALLEWQGRTAREHVWLEVAEQALRGAVETRRRGSDVLPTAEALRQLAEIRHFLGNSEEAVRLWQEALALAETIPDNLLTADVLADLGWRYATVGTMAEGEEFMRRAEKISSQRAPGSSTDVKVMRRLGGFTSNAGDFVGTERLWRRTLEGELALDPKSRGTVIAYLNLGYLAYLKGDLDAAETWARKGLPLASTLETRGERAILLGNLADVALARRDLDRAETLLKETLAQMEAAALEPYHLVTALVGLGRVARARGDHPRARAFFERAIAHVERTQTRSYFGLEAYMELAEVHSDDRDWPKAEAHYRRAFAEHEGLEAPILRARLLHGAGVVARALGRVEEAERQMAEAVSVIEMERGTVVGSDEARSLFASKFFGIYHDYARLHLERGRPAEAFDVIEKLRARSLLALLAERDVVLDDEIPAALEQERRRVDAEYQRTHRSLLGLHPTRQRAKFETVSRRLAELREAQARIGDEVRRASPRLAALRYPQPLRASEVQASLEPGAVLLVYSVGRDATLLFALTADSGLEAVRIDVPEPELRRRVNQWRESLERAVARRESHVQGGALYDLLLRPVESRVRGATQVLVSADGPLHAVPFAALRRDGRYLAESKPIGLVPSGTMLAQWVRSRPSSWATSSLFGFGDPRRPPAGLEPLPESRREVLSLSRLFPGSAALTGDAATEERAKRMGREARYVHFACHTVLNEGLPLDSGLALQSDAEHDGLLQAWEVYERVRLEADLVVLSACDSASGAVRAGEGLLGLTRAFQYAGARTVLASLWSVGDRSARRFMEQFYGRLAKGESKTTALHRTQRAAIRAGHAPLRWAAYQLYGDWR